ncbi:lysylphosphatidylglycerol synthase domain-containing protein [Methylohalobius crimeensis]|uniref:lysylphosphatidylglycerol synthase domain-containing protein n=1 Tax=Methylohalobius crimeensis TaxID=244365 RepID=UPI0003B5C2EC|nr:lysylphosphatidylglycerol synthase domain-containing protein [Methylohalobius crimeensis]
MNRKSLITALGGALALATLYYAGLRLKAEWRMLQDWHPDFRIWAVLAAAALGYALACLLLVSGWRRLLAGLGAENPAWTPVCRIYARSQLGKYLPGNIFHLLGRQALGHRYGIGQKVLAASTFYELTGLGVAAATLALPTLSWVGLHLAAFHLPPAWLGIGLTGLGLVMSAGLARRLRHTRWHWILNRGVTVAWLWAYLNYLIFFLLAGGLLVVVTLTLTPRTPDSLAVGLLPGLFAAGWLAGFVTPGAPSGIGIREGILILGLEHMAPGAPGALIALLLRGATVLGDGLFFLLFGNPWTFIKERH